MVGLRRFANGLIAISMALLVGRYGWGHLRATSSSPIGLGSVALAPVSVDGVETTLAELNPGVCQYVVVYWDRCEHCQRLARHWTQDIVTSMGPIHPADWAIVWVSRFSFSDEASITLPPHPIELALATDDSDQLSLELGIEAYPSHLVLDRAGRILERGQGGPLPRHPDRFSSSCVITEE